MKNLPRSLLKYLQRFHPPLTGDRLFIGEFENERRRTYCRGGQPTLFAICAAPGRAAKTSQRAASCTVLLHAVIINVR